MSARPIIRNANRLWKTKKLSVAFFEYLNVTLQCRSACPLEVGTADFCRLFRQKEIIHALYYSCGKRNIKACRGRRFYINSSKL